MYLWCTDFKGMVDDICIEIESTYVWDKQMGKGFVLSLDGSHPELCTDERDFLTTIRWNHAFACKGSLFFATWNIYFTLHLYELHIQRICSSFTLLFLISTYVISSLLYHFFMSQRPCKKILVHFWRILLHMPLIFSWKCL